MSLLLLLYGIETPEADQPEPVPTPTVSVTSPQSGLLLRQKRNPEVYQIIDWREEEEFIILN